MKEKLRKLILPFFLISIGFLVCYSLFYWLVFIQLELFDVREEIFGCYVPITISTLITWFFLRNKLRLIEASAKFKDGMLFGLWILLTAPIITFVFYLDTKTSTLIHLNNVDEIISKKKARCYSIDTYNAHKNKSGMYVSSVSASKGNEIWVGCYFACPLTNQNHSTNGGCIWAVEMFGKKFSNRVFDDKKLQKDKISRFIEESIAQYKRHNFNASYLKRLPNSSERDDFIEAIKQTQLSTDTKNLIILKEESGNYESREGTSLWWTCFFIISSNCIWLLSISAKKLKLQSTEKI